MIVLNKSNGEIKIDHYIFNANTTNLELESFKNVLTQTSNTGTKFYTITDIDNGDSTFQFVFYNGKLQAVNIGAGINYAFPPFVITEEEKNIIRMKLEKIGGENIYPWGKVEFNEDKKGGIVSVLIKYN